MAQFYVGTTVTLEAEFRNKAGALADPTTIKVHYRAPTDVADTTSTYIATGNPVGWTRTSAGLYTYDIEVDEHGTWTYAFEGTGAVDVYEPKTFGVLPRPAG